MDSLAFLVEALSAANKRIAELEERVATMSEQLLNSSQDKIKLQGQINNLLYVREKDGPF